MADTTVILSWINIEVDQALKVVRENIARFSNEREDPALLKACPGHLHQVAGALRMVGLAGATRFCEAIESSFGGLNVAEAGAEQSRPAIGIIDRAVLTLKEFVGDLSRGDANVPLRLFPVYRDLAALQGKGDATEKDLFFPDLTLKTPLHPDPKTATAAELPLYLQNQRSRFQRGMLAMLRNQPVGGLEEMRGALDALYQVEAQLPEPKGLWWAALGLIEALVNAKEAAPDAEWLGQAKAVCNKIDFQMRDLASGSSKINEQVMREVLYAIAKCKPAGARIRTIKQLYQLDSLFPAAKPKAAVADVAGVDPAFLEPALQDLRARLDALKSTWLQYVGGEPRSVLRFRDLIGAFKEKVSELGNRQLTKLLDAISLVAAKLPDPYPQQKQFMVIEMASAFLLVESLIETFTNPPENVEEPIAIMGGWLLDAAQGKSTGEPPAGLRADLTQQIGALQLRAQVAKEVLANLQHVEQVLDAFARDSGKRDSLQGIESHLRQINGALVVLGLERAAEILAICETMVAVLAAADHPRADEDMDWIAEGLSSLGFYLAPCLNGREPAAHAIDLFYRRFERRDVRQSADTTTVMRSPLQLPEPAPRPPELAAWQPPAKPAALVPEPAKPAPLPRAEVNEELLSIYLDEAGEVLATIDSALPLCREQADHRDALTTIRRGFHTLKGSGRMVGLMDLGEVAWEIEQVMNRWLEQQRPATPGLLELIGGASAAFADWVVQLRAGNLTGEIRAETIVSLARKLKAREDTPPPAAPATLAGTPASLLPKASPDDTQEIIIGTTRLPLSLFEIYVHEAVAHVGMLEMECTSWRKAPGQEASHEFMRAAHTLASSSRTTGFQEIGQLAGLLEQWMPFARQTVGAGDGDIVDAAIARLREMVAALMVRQPPRAAEEAAGRMLELIARVQARPKPVEAALAPAAAAAEVLPVESTSGVQEGQASAAPSGREARRMHDDIDEQLLPIFLEEAQELLPQIGRDLRDWKANTADERISQSLRRGLHTLKGSARMAGAIRLGELTHLMESRMEAAIEANQFTAELFVDLEDKMDRLSIDLERMGGTIGAPAAMDATAGVPAAPVFQPVAAPVAAAPQSIGQVAAPSKAEAPTAAAPKAEPPLPNPAAMLRINAETLDHLITESGEVSIARSRVESELRGVKQALSDLGDSISRMRTQLREVEVQADSQMQSRMSVMEERRGEFDPLEFDRYTRLQELTRMMAEGLHDVTSIQQALLKHLGDSDAALLHQARISRDVQQELMRMRAVPFSNLNERLYRIVRQTARDLDKKAELEIEGAQVELDRSVLERMGAPLEHMLRNALAHGLETPAQRVAAGKPEAGRIGITLRQESNEIALVFSDDGAGIDLEKLRRKALEKGFLQPGQEPPESELAQLIFVSGLSTADAVSQVSGRGVGMDVVRNEISSIGGRVDIATVRGKGTTFTIYLPLTLAVTQAVMVRSGTTVIAISSAMVEQVLRLKADGITSVYDTRVIELQDRKYPLHYFQHLLGTVGPIDIQSYNSVLLLRSGIQRIALHVDELIGNQEIVVKNIGPQLARVPGVAGATVLPDGGIVLIMNPVVLGQRARQIQAKVAMELVGSTTRAVRAVSQAAAKAEATNVSGHSLSEPALSDADATVIPAGYEVIGGNTTALPAPVVFSTEVTKAASQVVMVVDDSLTVRKITSRLLEREGYTVLTAKDGVDALEQMKETLPGVMLVDIEMPRMDGFDLAKNVRGDSRTAGIPIIIISSRTADKHRNQAAQLGVNAFLGKPYQESELLQHVAAYLNA